MKVCSRPVIVDGQPRQEFFLESDNGDFVRLLTLEEIESLNAQFREHMLEFWGLPAGQLKEWGKTPEV